jgi:succinate dehydrogenase / fumarate reductase iron-sulfur subunit
MRMSDLNSVSNRRITISIYRSESRSYVDYTVPLEDGMVVLDAVRYVQEFIDTTLAIRWNCKAARCGSCAAEINNMPKLMCKTRIDTLPDKIRVAPMGAFTNVSDLVTDVSENYMINRQIPEFKPDERAERPWRIAQIDVDRTKEFRKCIECFLCQDVCHVIREHKADYVGPRHVVKVASLDMHPLDTLDRSEFLNREGGLGFCNITKCCQEVCPEGIHITDNAIIQEKERAVDGDYDPLLWISRKIRHNR